MLAGVQRDDGGPPDGHDGDQAPLGPQEGDGGHGAAHHGGEDEHEGVPVAGEARLLAQQQDRGRRAGQAAGGHSHQAVSDRL